MTQNYKQIRMYNKDGTFYQYGYIPIDFNYKLQLKLANGTKYEYNVDLGGFKEVEIKLN